MSKKLNELTIIEALEGLKKKEFSCFDLSKACLDRVEQVDGKIKAFITVSKDKALKKAKKIDILVKENKQAFLKKPLLGIPYSAKDVFCTKDLKTTASSRILENYIPKYTATSIRKLDQAGAILIGKTNCDPFGFGSSTENSGFQTTHNPWNLNKVPGGSSGGSAAAVATDMGLFSMAEDTGGSIRQPAGFCSVTGLKVTYGRVSRYGVIAYGSSLDTIGPMAKNAKDLALVLSVIAGKDKYDATTLDIKVPDYLKNIKKPIQGLKIALPKEYFAKGINDSVLKSVKNAAKEFEKLGAVVKTVSLPHTKYAVPAYYLTAMSEVSANLARYDGIRFGSNRFLFEEEVKRRIMLGTYALSSGYYDAYYKKAMKVRSLLKKDFAKVFSNMDLILAPVSPTPPFDIGEKSNDPLSMWLADIYTVTINPAGLPSLAIPCGFTKDNLPIGMQLVGPQLSEELLLQTANFYQENTDWHKRKPKI